MDDTAPTEVLLKQILIPALFLGAAEAPKVPFPVTYEPGARRPLKPNAPLWTGPAPCSNKLQGTESVKGASVTGPKRIDKWKTDFPAENEKKKWGWGSLLAEVVISPTGRVSNVRILRSNSEGFDMWVLQDLAHHQYEPARLNGEPVEVCLGYTARPHL